MKSEIKSMGIRALIKDLRKAVETVIFAVASKTQGYG